MKRIVKATVCFGGVCRNQSDPIRLSMIWRVPCPRQSNRCLEFYQRAFIRWTVVACHVVERPDGVVTPRSVRNLASDFADASGDMSQSSMNCFIFFAVSSALVFLPSAAFKQSSRGCCQTNENSHRIACAALIYALNSWRHSVRAAVRLSLKLSRE